MTLSHRAVSTILDAGTRLAFELEKQVINGQFVPGGGRGCSARAQGQEGIYKSIVELLDVADMQTESTNTESYVEALHLFMSRSYGLDKLRPPMEGLRAIADAILWACDPCAKKFRFSHSDLILRLNLAGLFCSAAECANSRDECERKGITYGGEFQGEEEEDLSIVELLSKEMGDIIFDRDKYGDSVWEALSPIVRTRGLNCDQFVGYGNARDVFVTAFHSVVI